MRKYSMVVVLIVLTLLLLRSAMNIEEAPTGTILNETLETSEVTEGRNGTANETTAPSVTEHHSEAINPVHQQTEGNTTESEEIMEPTESILETSMETTEPRETELPTESWTSPENMSPPN